MKEIKVVVPSNIREWLEGLLDVKGLYLFPIPVEDDLPTYGIAIRSDVLARLAGSSGPESSTAPDTP